MIPHWAKGKPGLKLVNAKAETLLEKPAYRGLVRRSRCLIPADGFYEWTVNQEGRKQPVRFTLADEGLFALAGVWTSWTDEQSGEGAASCTIVTTRPNELVAGVHDRMPVILPRDLESDWLDPDTSREHAISLLEPYPAELMRATEASLLVNSVRNEGPELLAAA